MSDKKLDVDYGEISTSTHKYERLIKLIKKYNELKKEDVYRFRPSRKDQD